MKKRILCSVIALMMFIMSLSACVGKGRSDIVEAFPSAGTETLASSEQESESESEAETIPNDENMSEEEFKKMLAAKAETLGEGYSIAAVENENGEIVYKFVPTVFEVYADGEVHNLMYGANVYSYMYAPFINTSFPEYNVSSISLPVSLVLPENGTKVLAKEDMTARMEMEDKVLYDTSARYSTEEVRVLSIEDKTCLFRAWSVPYSENPSSIDMNTMHSFYPKKEKMYGLDDSEWKVEQLEDGSYCYSTMCFLLDYADGVEGNAYARYKVIVRGSRAYCYLAGAYKPQTAYWGATYILNSSFVFN